MKTAVNKNIFFDLLKRKEGRRSEHAKGKHITYDEHIIVEYLRSN